ncbi:hypothetical protein GCM10009872_45190 [Actinopolymorpha rutila]
MNAARARSRGLDLALVAVVLVAVVLASGMVGVCHIQERRSHPRAPLLTPAFQERTVLSGESGALVFDSDSYER